MKVSCGSVKVNRILTNACRLLAAGTTLLMLVATCGAQVSNSQGGNKGTGVVAANISGGSKGSAATQPAAESDYVIGIEDVLAINVWHEPEMSKSVPVRPDGKISLPLLGEFTAAGQTPKQLQDVLAKQLGTLINNPQVTVIVEKINSQKFKSVGEVEKPGSYPLTKPMTVLDAVAVAGGIKDFAKPTKIYVLRRKPDGSTTRMAFNYKKALKGATDQNFELEERDTVVVP